MIRPRFYVLTLMVLAAAAMRLLPHPPNMTPIAALALFGGAQFDDKRLAIVAPLTALFLSDMVLGFHSTLPIVYLSFVLIAMIGLGLRGHHRPAWIAGAAVASSVLFFALSNLGVWSMGGLYPRTLAGLAECFAAALPFFRNSLIGDLAYSGLLFGLFALLERRFTVLKPATQSLAA
jgi:hypothetical protein